MESTKKRSVRGVDWKRWIQLICLCVGGGSIYFIPFMAYAYWVPMQEAFGFSDSQIGTLLSVYGLVALCTYFVGGWLADRFSARKLLTISYLITGATGLFFATFPSYGWAIVCQAIWAVSTVFTFWAALIKATRLWGSKVEQGKGFGLLESGRGVAGLVLTMAGVSIFAGLGSGPQALRWVIITWSACSLAVAPLTWFLFEDTGREQDTRQIFRNLGPALKLPAVWLVAIIVMCAYTANNIVGFATPFATDLFGMSPSAAALLASAGAWMNIIAAGVVGVIADRIGSSRILVVAFVILAACCAALVIVPGSAGLVFLLVIIIVVANIAVYALRALYWALMEEGGIPILVTGTAIGVISTIGYSGDFFFPPTATYFMEKYPGGTGYDIVFALLAGFAVVGLAVTVVFMRKYRANRMSILEAKRSGRHFETEGALVAKEVDGQLAH